MKRWFVGLLILALVQLSHWLLLSYEPNLVHINPTGSWSLPIGNVANILLTSVLLILIVLVGTFAKPRWPWPLMLIFVGGVSNSIDRIAYSGVVDYINIKIWPIFNLPDVLITISVIWYLIIALRPQNRDR